MTATATADTTPAPFECWAVVEMLGHRKIAGRVTERPVAGTTLLQIDVPETAGHPAFTRLIGGGAIYAITPCSEEVARAAAEQCYAEPLPVYIPRQLGAGRTFPAEIEIDEEADNGHD